jgi:hypothetical protein
MSTTLLRRYAAAAAGLATVLGCALGGTTAADAHTSTVHAAKGGGSVKPGFTGAPIVLQDVADYHGYDVQTDETTGTAYVGWVGSAQGQLRTVHLCVLPAGATACAGGVLTTAPGGDGSSVAGLHVVVTAPGTVLLAWYTGGVDGGHIAQATYAGGALGASSIVAPAPNGGALLDVVKSPSGQVYSVVQDPSTLGPQHLQVRAGLTTAVADITAPWQVTRAELAFDGANPVLVTDQYGAVESPAYFTAGPSWPALAPIGGTWTIDNAVEDVVTTKYGVRAIASEPNSSYRPVVASYQNGSFGKPELTGDDNSCNPTSHDLVTDASGRAADVATECGDLMISNLADGEHAGTVKVPAGGLIASGTPQITTVADGGGWVVWSVQDATVGNRLQVAPIQLPALILDSTKKAAAGSVSIAAPVGCLPAVTAKAAVSAKPKHGWKLVSKQLVVGHKKVGKSDKLHGEKDDSGDKTKLKGSATFRKGSHTVTVKAKTVKVTAC